MMRDAREYLITTGHPADGSATARRRPDDESGLHGSQAQLLVNPRVVNPTSRGDVRAWMKQRAYRDASMRTGSRP